MITALRDVGVVVGLWTLCAFGTAGAWWALAHLHKTRTNTTRSPR